MTQQPLITTPAWKLGTIAIHSDYSVDPTTHVMTMPTYQTAAFASDDVQHGTDLFNLRVPGNIYSRIMNPTSDVLEKYIAALEGGIDALALALGQVAVIYTTQTIVEASDNIVSANALHGGTYNLFTHTLPLSSITTRFADPHDPASFEALTDDRIKTILTETVDNPLGNITDTVASAEIVHRHGVPLIVDNAIPTPCLTRSSERGTDIVVHSLTKYLSGHGMSLGGTIVNSGRFPWAKREVRFKRLNEPDVNYHGVVYTEALGSAAHIGHVHVVPLHNTGAALSPSNAFLILQGIETLGLRIDRIMQNAARIAWHLRDHAKVEWVSRASLDGHPDHALVRKYLLGKAPGLLIFGVKGGFAVGVRFQDALQLLTRLVNVSDARLLATHPAPTTHRQLSEAELAKVGVRQETIQLSVDIEYIDDLLVDLDQALTQA